MTFGLILSPTNKSRWLKQVNTLGLLTYHKANTHHHQHRHSHQLHNMTAIKKTPSTIPVSFEQFKKNPIAAVAFCMLLAVSYLYVDLRSGYKEQIEKSNQKIDALDLKIDRLSYALKKSDSALAAAITEIRIMNTMRKL